MNNTKYVSRIREFNRFYTVLLGIVDSKYLDKYSLAESRIMYEIYTSPGCTAVSIINKLQLDKSYMSRIVKKLMKEGLLERREFEDDARYYRLYLTDYGNQEAEKIIQISNARVGELISSYDEETCREISNAMDVITKYLKQEDD